MPTRWNLDASHLTYQYQVSVGSAAHFDGHAFADYCQRQCYRISVFLSRIRKNWRASHTFVIHASFRFMFRQRYFYCKCIAGYGGVAVVIDMRRNNIASIIKFHSPIWRRQSHHDAHLVGMSISLRLGLLHYIILGDISLRPYRP